MRVGHSLRFVSFDGLLQVYGLSETILKLSLPSVTVRVDHTVSTVIDEVA